MDEKTPRVFNRKIAEDGQGYDSGGSVGDEGSDQMRILGKVSSEYDYSDEKKESELVNVEQSGHYRNARGSGWIQNTMSPTSKSSATPNRRNHSAAVNVLEKLQQEVASKPAYRKPSPMERMRDSDAQEASSSAVRYKFAEPKSDAQVKKDKQRSWKQKMKIAQERKRQERKNLDEVSKQGGGDQFGRMMVSCVLDSVEHAEFFKNFTRCGDLPDEDSAYEGWSAASSMGTSDEDESDAHIVSREGRGRNRVPRRPSESSNSSRDTSSVSTSEQEESPSPPTAEKYPAKKKSAKSRSAAGAISKSDSRQAVMKPPATAPASPKRVASPKRQAESFRVQAVTPGSLQSQPQRSSFNASSVHPAHHTNHSRLSASTMTTRPPTPSKERNFINAFLDDMKTMGESMLWHKETSVLNPTTITIHIMKGYRCGDGTFCAPRLSWRDEAKDENYELDLFDIQSLKKADALELANFPYAMPGRTVCMKVSTGTWFIFEARSEDDAFRFVRGIRWVVSRLAFNLVIGNVDVSCELLDLGLVEEEFDWSRAMDDVADQLLEKALATTMI